jgi:hypothetical protein
MHRRYGAVHHPCRLSGTPAADWSFMALAAFTESDVTSSLSGMRHSPIAGLRQGTRDTRRDQLARFSGSTGGSSPVAPAVSDGCGCQACRPVLACAGLPVGSPDPACLAALRGSKMVAITTCAASTLAVDGSDSIGERLSSGCLLLRTALLIYPARRLERPPGPFSKTLIVARRLW